MLGLGRILILDLVVANLLMYSLPVMILPYLAASFFTLKVFWMRSRLTVVSREAKKKQHACASSGPRDHYSELFTRMAALKF